MLTWTSIFTGLISSADVTTLITQTAYVIGGIIVVLVVLAPAFIAKSGFSHILHKVSTLFGGKAGR